MLIRNLYYLFLVNKEFCNDNNILYDIYIIIITSTIAGSCGQGAAAGFVGGSDTCRSLMSLPRNMISSNTSFLGGIGLSVGRFSVPKERTVVTD